MSPLDVYITMRSSTKIRTYSGLSDLLTCTERTQMVQSINSSRLPSSTYPLDTVNTRGIRSSFSRPFQTVDLIIRQPWTFLRCKRDEIHARTCRCNIRCQVRGRRDAPAWFALWSLDLARSPCKSPIQKESRLSDFPFAPVTSLAFRTFSYAGFFLFHSRYQRHVPGVNVW